MLSGLTNSLGLFGITVVVMLGILALGVVGGVVNARIKERRYLAILNADVKRPIVPRSAN